MPASLLLRIGALQTLWRAFAATDEGNVEVGLLDVFIIDKGDDLGLVEVVNINGFENENFYEVANTNLRHEWNGDDVRMWVRTRSKTVTA